MDIKEIEFDTELMPGAHNAISVCMRVKLEERVTIITDSETLEIAASLAAELDKVGSEYKVFVLEDYVTRPAKIMPPAILEHLAKSNVSIFAAQAQQGELQSRIQMTAVVDRHKIRHAHMVNITPTIMMEGMRADFIKIDEISTRLIEITSKAKVIKAVSKGGTDITAEFSPKLKWIKTSGLISVSKWGNLPGGEIFTSPATVTGHFVVDGVVGDYLCRKYGDLINNPLIIDIKDSRITQMSCDNEELLKEFTDYTMADENSNRVGEFAIGTNIALKGVIGNILQDEKLPGLHMAFGHPYAEHTGADWTSSTHIDCVGTHFDIWADDIKVMEDGKFLI
jgi:aminopeptidase